MMLNIRLIDSARRGAVAAYAHDVLVTLQQVAALVATKNAWHSEGGRVPLEPKQMAAQLAKCQVRNNVGHVMERMGISARFFLPATRDMDVYATFDVAVSSEHTCERVVLEIDSRLIPWSRLLDLFMRQIQLWKPKTADIMNYSSLVVVSEELAGKVPVGFACYRSGVFITKIPECASKVDLDTGTLVFLGTPRFDASLEEGQQLARIAALLS